MVGKDPHRPEGKTRDAEHMGAVATSKGAPHRSPSEKAIADGDARAKERHEGEPSARSEAVGGSRPGVESRVKEAIAKREAREDDA